MISKNTKVVFDKEGKIAVAVIILIVVILQFINRDVNAVPPTQTQVEEWRTLEGNVNIGVPVYLNAQFSSAHDYVGVVTQIQDAHTFPDGTTRKAVHIKNQDGGSVWIPFSTAEVMYDTKIRVTK